MRLRAGAFGRSVVTVATASLGAQVIGVLVLPVLSRLYSESDFGIYSVALSLSLISTTVATLRLELAAAVVESEQTARDMVRISVTSVIGWSLLCTLVACASYLLGWDPFHLGEAVLLVAPMTASIAIFLIQRQWMVRKRNYRTYGRVDLMSAGASAAVMSFVPVVSSGPQGLFVGQIVGRVVPAIALESGRGKLGALRIRPSVESLAYARRFVRFQLPAGLLIVATGQFIVVIPALLFDSDTTGLIAMAIRVVAGPALLVTAAVEQVTRGELSFANRSTGTKLSAIHASILRRTVMAGALLTLCVAVTTPWAIPLVLGDNWSPSGVLALVLSPTVGAGLAAGVMVQFLLVTQRHTAFLVSQLIMFTLCLSPLVVARFAQLSPVGFVAIYSVALTAAHVITVLITWRIIGRLQPGRVGPPASSNSEGEGLA